MDSRLGQDAQLSASDLVIETPNVSAEETAAIYLVLAAAVHQESSSSAGEATPDAWTASARPRPLAVIPGRERWRTFTA